MARQMAERNYYLPDVPVVYMVDARTDWESWKRAVRDAAVAWGLKEWLTTVVHGGAKWLELEQLGVFLQAGDEDLPLKAEEEEEGEGERRKKIEEREVPKLSEQMRQALGISERDQDFFQFSVVFVNTLTMRRESDRKAPARQKLWTWMVKSLQGNANNKMGPYHYLVDEVEQLDVAALYMQLVRVIDTPTILSQADEVDALCNYAYKPTQEIFEYLSTIKKQTKRNMT